jgi:hypothetical protein
MARGRPRAERSADGDAWTACCIADDHARLSKGEGAVDVKAVMRHNPATASRE